MKRKIKLFVLSALLLISGLLTGFDASAKLYAITGDIRVTGDCMWIYVTVYDDNNSSHLGDDTYVGSGWITNCKGNLAPLPPSEGKDTDHQIEGRAMDELDLTDFGYVPGKEEGLWKSAPVEAQPIDLEQSSLKVYPNPTESSAKIEIGNGRVVSGFITSESGELVKQLDSSSDSDSYSIDLRNYSPGVYMAYLLFDDHRIRTAKIVISPR